MAYSSTESGLCRCNFRNFFYFTRFRYCWQYSEYKETSTTSSNTRSIVETLGDPCFQLSSFFICIYKGIILPFPITFPFCRRLRCDPEYSSISFSTMHKKRSICDCWAERNFWLCLGIEFTPIRSFDIANFSAVHMFNDSQFFETQSNRTFRLTDILTVFNFYLRVRDWIPFLISIQV